VSRITADGKGQDVNENHKDPEGTRWNDIA